MVPQPGGGGVRILNAIAQYKSVQELTQSHAQRRNDLLVATIHFYS